KKPPVQSLFHPDGKSRPGAFHRYVSPTDTSFRGKLRQTAPANLPVYHRKTKPESTVLRCPAFSRFSAGSKLFQNTVAVHPWCTPKHPLGWELLPASWPVPFWIDRCDVKK